MMIQFPLDSNIRYLPLVYLLPPDLIARCPTLCALPRCLSEIAASDDMMDMITGDAFLKEIMDAVASLAFPHFGFGGLEGALHRLFPGVASVLLFAYLDKAHRGRNRLGLAGAFSYEARYANTVSRHRAYTGAFRQGSQAGYRRTGMAAHIGRYQRNAMRRGL